MSGMSTHHKALAAILEGNRLVKYKILIADTVIGLAEFVNREMALEWRPLGGIAIYNSGPDGISYYQAMEADRTAAVAEVVLSAEK
jgi:hypothetical protein